MRSDAEPAGSRLLERARALHEAGQHADAESAAMSALRLAPGSTSDYRLLARIERALGHAKQEAGALEQALATRHPGPPGDTAELWTRLGFLRGRQGDRRGSLAAYDRAVSDDPHNRLAREGLARMHLALQDLDNARKCVADLERYFPDSAVTHLLAGHAHKASGDSAAASDSYERALGLNPDLGEALYNLVDLNVPGMEHKLARQTALLISRNDLADADRINVSFAHARILDKAGQYQQSFEAIRRANELARKALVRQGVVYSPLTTEARIAKAVLNYPASGFRAELDRLPVELTPVFVIGLPRSGTTLIEQILASHSEVQAGGELPFAQECEAFFRQRREAAGREGAIDPAHPVDAGLLEAARERYIDALFERDLNGPLIIDKLPANFEIAGFLSMMFPGAPIIHSVRDPRASCFSLYCANFAAHEPWYHDLDHIVHYYGQYRRLMEHWASVIPSPFIEVIYEELVREPEKRIAALLESVGLPFEPGCLDFHRQVRPIFTASHAQVRRPMYGSAVDHWRNYADWLTALESLPSL